MQITPDTRRSYVFAALSSDLDGGGTDSFFGRDAYGIAEDLYRLDPDFPFEIETPDEIIDDVQAWIDAHPGVTTTTPFNLDAAIAESEKRFGWP